MPSQSLRLEKLSKQISSLKQKKKAAKPDEAKDIDKNLTFAMDRRDLGVVIHALSESGNLDALVEMISKSSKNDDGLQASEVITFCMKCDNKLSVANAVRKIFSRHDSEKIEEEVFRSEVLAEVYQDYPKEVAKIVKNIPATELVEFATKTPDIAEVLTEVTGMEKDSVGEMLGSSAKQAKDLMLLVMENHQDVIDKTFNKDNAELAQDASYKKNIAKITTSNEMVDFAKSLSDEKLIEFATKSPAISKILKESTGLEGKELQDLFASSSKELKTLIVKILEQDKEFVTKTITKNPLELTSDEAYKASAEAIAKSKEMKDLLHSVPEDKLISAVTKSPKLTIAVKSIKRESKSLEHRTFEQKINPDDLKKVQDIGKELNQEGMIDAKMKLARNEAPSASPQLSKNEQRSR